MALLDTLRKVGNAVAPVVSAVSTAAKNNNTTTTKPSNSAGSITSPATGTVRTNTAYNGSYLDVDLGTDYQAKINDAVSRGDYNAAAQFEAQRNAKINYLNSVGQNTGGHTTSTNYLTDYSKKFNSSNNKGGVSYTSSFNDFDNLPDNWTSANIGGGTYINKNGNIYRQTGITNNTPNYRLVGNRINPETGEWMFDNYEDAKKAAYDEYLSVIGGGNFANQEEAYRYLDANNVLGKDYIERVMNGTNVQHFQKLADEMYNKEQQAIKEAKKQQALNSYYDEEYNNLSDDDKEVLDTNSFETDFYPDYRYQNDYYDYMKKQELKRRTGVM